MRKIVAAVPVSFVLLVVVACGSSSPPPSSATPNATNATNVNSATPPTSPSPVSGARAIPALDLACKADADCIVFDEVTRGELACCPGCTWNPSNKTSLDAFRAACTKSPAPQCPALSCLMPIMEAKCVAGTCSAVKKQ